MSSGLGEGRYFMSIKEYRDQFVKLIGTDPFQGTLNLKVGHEYANEVNELKSQKGIWINGFRQAEKTFGGVAAFRAEIYGAKCVVIFPERSKHTDIIELVANQNLRDTLGLKDGDSIKVEVKL